MNSNEKYDSYEIEEPSDEERAGSSSEDELEVLLYGTQDQKRKLIREYLTGESESSSEDEFEKEMEAELSSTMKTMGCKWGAPTASGAAPGSSSPSASTAGAAAPQFYDSVYFDSDSEEEKSDSSASRREKQHRIPSNDELLYDPNKDDNDQAWVDAERRKYRESRNRKLATHQGEPSQALPRSDAVLNCPACMITLCLDCQRHEKYRTQYRAMFVMNCTVNKEEVLRYKSPNDKQRRNRRKRRQGHRDVARAGPELEETYHPVQCAECSTEVAVFDKDEVYHFYNILASHS